VLEGFGLQYETKWMKLHPARCVSAKTRETSRVERFDLSARLLRSRNVLDLIR
jgi:hypothetical protein